MGERQVLCRKKIKKPFFRNMNHFLNNKISEMNESRIKSLQNLTQKPSEEVIRVITQRQKITYFSP
jgi:hypothetical protein